jgi:hypothetical protein
MAPTVRGRRYFFARRLSRRWPQLFLRILVPLSKLTE